MRSLLDVYNQLDVSDNYMVEGINIEEKRGKYYVSLTDVHNKGVDFSITTNPCYYKYKGHQVISIFKRTKLKSDSSNYEFDGNPLLYALKKDPKYILDITNDDIIKYIRRLKTVINEIKTKYDTIIVTQSNHSINNWFMRALNNEIQCSVVITDYFIKVDGREIWEDFDYDGFEDLLTDEFGYGQVWDKRYNLVTSILDSWRDGAKVQIKNIPSQYRKFIKTIVTVNNKIVSDVHDKICDKNVLILDDTISSGKTISNSADIIINEHNPKSVTIITLFSKK